MLVFRELNSLFVSQFVGNVECKFVFIFCVVGFFLMYDHNCHSYTQYFLSIHGE